MPKKIEDYDLKNIEKDPIKYASEANTKDLANLIKLASDSYYNTGHSIMTDKTYDLLEDVLRQVDPNNHHFKEVGAPVHRLKVNLPYWMGSMTKIKTDSEIARWTKKHKGPYHLSEKLDGISCLLTYNLTGKETKLYTRGDGAVGHDVSHLVQYLGLPKIKTKLAVRGEIIISKKTFNNKYAKQYENARNMTAGVVNSLKSLDIKEAKDHDLLIYEIIDPADLTPEEQFTYLKKSGFKVPETKLLKVKPDDLTAPVLSKILQDWKKKSNYEIDGVIITNNTSHERNIDGNPEYSRAFKEHDLSQQATVTVKEVIWNPSKYGKLVPQIHYDTVKLAGANLSYATGFNGKYIKDNKIGPGAKITIIRSGDVIPYILDVVKPAKTPQMPKQEYVWHKSGIDVYLKNNKSEDTVMIKLLTDYLKLLGVEGISKAIMIKIYVGGFTSLKKILKMTKADFLTLPGVKEKSADNYYQTVQNILKTTHEPEVIMVVSGAFGASIGRRRLRDVIKAFPDIFTRKTLTHQDFETVFGFQEKTAQPIIDGLSAFQKFVKDHPELKFWAPSGNKINPITKSGKLKDHFIVMTGFRDKILESYIETEGGTNQSSVNSKTTILLIKDTSVTSSKIEKAKNLGIKIFTVDVFRKTYT